MYGDWIVDHHLFVDALGRFRSRLVPSRNGFTTVLGRLLPDGRGARRGLYRPTLPFPPDATVFRGNPLLGICGDSLFELRCVGVKVFK